MNKLTFGYKDKINNIDKDINININNIDDNDDDNELRVQPPSWIVENVKKTLAKQNFTNYDRKFSKVLIL